MLNGEAVETTRKMEVWLLLASFARFAQKLPWSAETQDKVYHANQHAPQLTQEKAINIVNVTIELNEFRQLLASNLHFLLPVSAV